MNVVIPCFGGLEPLPPALTLISLLEKGGHTVSVVTLFEERYEKEKIFGERVHISHILDSRMPVCKDLRVREYLRRIDELRRKIYVKKIYQMIAREMKKENSVLWILHEVSLEYLGEKIKNYKYIITIYELDRHLLENKKVINLIKHAHQVVVPEYNRAHLARGLLGLKRLPLVIPNKPSYHPEERMLPITDSEMLRKLQSIKSTGKKIVLYMGIMNPSRKLDTFIEAYTDSDKYELVIMGKKAPYLEELQKKYKGKFTYIGYLPAPNHLDVASYADIGVLVYIPEKNSINSAFCAPNKLFEYGGFGIPCLCNDVPGLRSQVMVTGCGLCTDIENKIDILEKTDQIMQDYDKYSQKIFDYYQSFDMEELVQFVLKDYQS